MALQLGRTYENTFVKAGYWTVVKEVTANPREKRRVSYALLRPQPLPRVAPSFVGPDEPSPRTDAQRPLVVYLGDKRLGEKLIQVRTEPNRRSRFMVSL